MVAQILLGSPLAQHITLPHSDFQFFTFFKISIIGDDISSPN